MAACIETELGEDAPTRKGPQVLRTVASLALGIAVIVFVLPQVADLSSVWDQIRGMTGLELAVLGVIAAWNLVTYWILVVLCTPGLTYPQAMVMTEAMTAVSNTVPAGGAVSIGLTYAMLESWGFSKSRISVSVIVSGIWNNLVKLAMPIVALACLGLQGDADSGRTAAAVAGLASLVAAVAVFALILRSEAFAARTGIVAGRVASRILGLVRRGPAEGWDEAVVKFRGRVVGLVRGRWLGMSVATVVGHLSLYAVLLVTLRQIGVSDHDVGWAEVLAVFAFARLLTAIPLTPGGLGVIELALVTGLTAAGGEKDQIVGAVLVFRLLTYVLPIPFGLVTYLFWRRNTSWLGSAPPLEAGVAEGAPA
ncbi:lysylphosphatidylglycerol synthase domain-containing protein [soil metagenome]